MQSLTELAKGPLGDSLTHEDLDWLHLILADWQMLSDLAAADLVMWLPTRDGRFQAVAHARPSTASTVHMDDVVGLYVQPTREAWLRQAMEAQQVLHSAAPTWLGTYARTEFVVPVVRKGRSIAVITRESNLSSLGFLVGAETWTVEAADTLCDMIATSEYPYDATPTSVTHGQPRVMDGAILIDAEGVVKQLTPNAVSCLRRLGLQEDPIGRSLIEDVTNIVKEDQQIDETLAVVVMGKASWRSELSHGRSTITIRAVPLFEDGVRIGAVLLTRDVSEMRRRELELMTKDATIREIHHRVKNNLQTVSALIRLQARRSDNQEVREALTEAERRVSAIATVHAALSQNVDEHVDFDEVAKEVLRLASVVATHHHEVSVDIRGSFGEVDADAAQALATVLTELVTNSVEHGYVDGGGVVVVEAHRLGRKLEVTVTDDGVGIDEGRARSGLGTQIVATVVAGELSGSIEWERRSHTHGTRVRIHALLEDK
ncbi:sensor histidine kinase [Gleimia hominis]|uniref:sensor histidine kinase n=1 Tax=Gleimia hominis TaxID=595468 RepID=UPI000C80576F|nr:sensor histidine kinase [Gleimia hominis]WIK63671.1 sensor histidine kinase [Gleimia hominis]